MKTLFFSFALLFCAGFVQAQSANFKTVTDNYARFGQGDIPGILSTLADNATWIHPGNPNIVAYAGTFTGPAGAGQFFDRVGRTTRIDVFQPSDFQESGNMVSNKVHIQGIILATGKSYVSDVLFTWNFDAAGKVARWEASGDVSSLEAAFMP